MFYRTQRQTTDFTNPLYYILVPDGNYQVRLKFAELVWQYAMLALDRIAAKQSALAPRLQSLERPA